LTNPPVKVFIAMLYSTLSVFFLGLVFALLGGTVQSTLSSKNSPREMMQLDRVDSVLHAHSRALLQGDGFDQSQRFGSVNAKNLIIVLVGTFPSTSSQTIGGFFGSGAQFAQFWDARILVALRPGAQYSFDNVNSIAANVRRQARPGQRIYVAGYSNGGGVAACVGPAVGAFGLVNWAGPANFVARGCNRGYRRAAMFVANSDQYRSAVISVWNSARFSSQLTFANTPGTHTTPLPSNVRNQLWQFMLG
jgi:hypothetical protein